MATGLNKGRGYRGGSEKFLITFNDLVGVFVDYINDNFSEDELNTISYYYYSLLPADFVARALSEARKQVGQISDSRRVADYSGQYIGESQYKDKYIELADMLYRMIPDGLTYHEANKILEDEGLVLVEYGGEKYCYAVYAYEDDERFGDYGNSDAGVWLDYEPDGEMYVTDAYKVG